MRGKVYYLSTCTTCARIIKELKLDKRGIPMQDIKTEPITSTQLKEMKELAGSYEALFSRVALKYRAMKLNERVLSEEEIRDLILQEYTFLKRPVIILNGQIFIGNAPKTIAAAKEALGK